jgi:hypothetical protein
MAEVRMQLDSQKCENTLYFRSVSPTPEFGTALAGLLIFWWRDHYAPLVSSQVKLNEVVITDLSSDTGFQVTQAPATLITGGISTSDTEPNNVTIAVSIRTAMRGRSFRGRNYVLGITNSQISNNTMDDTTITAWQAAYSELLTVASDADAVWVVVSRFSGIDADKKPIPRAAGIATEVTNVVLADATLDSQRKRLPGRGR